MRSSLRLAKSAKSTGSLVSETDDDTTVETNALLIGGSQVNAFVGINGGSDNAIGLSLENAEFGLALLASKADASRTWTSFQATASSLSFVGIDGITAAASEIHVSINQAGRANDKVVSYATGKTDLSVVTSSSTSLSFDMDGAEGEILVRAGQVMSGYLDDEAATASALVDGWLHTGDVGTMDEAGYVRITDRMKDLYISGGFNVYPAEVEKLLAVHPAIAMVAVVGVPDERMGEVGKAYVVLRPGAAATEAELIRWSRENMANYKVPRSFAFVEDLPRNASGKVLKTELRG